VAAQNELSMAGQAVLTITAPADRPDAEPLVPTALNLGWRLAQLNDAPVSRFHAAPSRGHRLPSPSEMDSGTRYLILLGQVDAGLKALSGIPGFPESDVSRIAELARDSANPGGVSDEIGRLHAQITESLAASKPRLATAYGLGRALADTCQAGGSAEREHLAQAFNHYRLENIYDWLAQLGEFLPARSARSVAQSIRMWEAWPQSSRRGRRRRADPAAPVWSVSAALTRQGEVWRRVLTAEQDPLGLLGPQDYVNAGVGFLIRIRRMVTQFVLQWAGVIFLTLAGFGAAIWAAVTYAATDTAKLAAVLASVVGALGISWKGVGGTLGKALGVVQKPLWDAEVDAALAMAITRLPAPQVPVGGLSGPPRSTKSPLQRPSSS
jgi:hypothetical protein